MNVISLDRRNTAFLGIFAAALFAIMWVAAIVADGNWVLGVETLSDLGHPLRAGHPLFNAAVLIAGVLLCIFGLGMLTAHWDNVLSRASMATVTVSSLFLVGVGVFPIHVSPQHTIATYAFFGLMILGLVLWIAYDLQAEGRQRLFGAATAAILAVSLAFLALTPLPLAEAVAVSAIMLWAVLLSGRLLLWEEA